MLWREPDAFYQLFPSEFVAGITKQATEEFAEFGVPVITDAKRYTESTRAYVKHCLVPVAS